MLNGKRILVTGVATPESIATTTAARCVELGAQVALTATRRDLAAATDVAADLDPNIPVFPFDFTEPGPLTSLGYQLTEQFGRLDGAVHAVADAPALTEPRGGTDLRDVERAARTSTWTLTALAQIVAPFAPRTGASLVALDFPDDGHAGPASSWMGVCKTALGATVRSLAHALGPQHVRVNLVAAGPLQTPASSVTPDFDRFLRAWETVSPLAWSPRDPAPVADTICFLLSDLARAITGETIHVDGGYHAMTAAWAG
ncbi:MAG: SDR family oxidoreductase [Actinomycetota bacterium]|jgi:meromycolic acid enoyl-[acyl-carrier-protein] reductase